MTASRAELPDPPRRDRRQERHQATRQEILDAAWDMVRADGLAALSLRALARAVGMEAQSLYTYFPSKNAIYDAMFAQGNTEFLEQKRALKVDDDPVRALTRGSHHFVEFCSSDPVRYQLLFQRTIPGFEPSEESYAIASEVLTIARDRLNDVGVTDSAAMDIYTALIAGLVDQQIANEPGGDRWTRHVDRVIEMYLDNIKTTTRRGR
jgi:AcrR family transcriptional regulator